MRLLLDTHIALWAISDDPRLSAKAAEMIASQENEIYVSTASIWEIAIKFALGGNRADAMPISGKQADQYFQEAGYQPLAIHHAHAAKVDGLPPLHADPFDRIIIAQAMIEPMQVLTHDERMEPYSDLILLV